MGTAASHIGPAGGQKVNDPADPRSKARLEKAAKDFEAVFVGYMLKSMRSTIPKDDMLGDGLGGDVMEGMFDAELSTQLSRQSHLGLAEMIYRSVTGESLQAAARSGTPVSQKVPAAGSTPPPAARPAASPAGTAVQAPAPRGHHVHARPAAKPQAAAKDSSTVEQRVDAYLPFIEQSAQKHGVDPNLLKAVIASESAGDSTARSPKDAKGLMQLVDSTAAAMGVKDVWDPEENIDGGAKYLQQMLTRFGGNVEHAVASYNAGPGAVEKHGGVPPIKETQEYVSRVMSFFKRFAQQDGGTDDAH